MTEYYFDSRGVELINGLYEALDEVREATEQLAQYVYEDHERDRYAFLHKVAHSRDYYNLADVICKCFDSLSESDQDLYFQV